MKSVSLSIASLLLMLAAPIDAAEILIHSQTENTRSTGNWYSASGASMPIDGNRGRYAIVGDEIETYTFIVTMPETTTYTLQVYNTCYSPRSQQVQQTLIYGNSNIRFITDQDCDTDPYVGQWRTMGNYEFSAGEQVEYEISTEGSNNQYVGASAIRYLYNQEAPPQDTPPVLTLSTTNLELAQSTPFSLTATATDNEDGEISANITWQSPFDAQTGTQYNSITSNQDFEIMVSVSDSNGNSVQETISITISSQQSSNRVFDFGCETGPLNPLGLSTYNGDALPDTGAMCGRYTAQLTDNNNNRTLFFHDDQGRLDGVVATFPLEAILRNVGTSPVDRPFEAHTSTADNAYNFVGLQIHHIDFNNVNSTHLVVGQRGNRRNTIEGKKTSNGRSDMNDIGNEMLPNGRADIRYLIDEQGNISAYWQEPNLTGDPANDNWIPYRGTGELPGPNPDWGQSNQVIVGMITYAYYSNGVPFWGVADQLEINELSMSQ